MQHARITGRGRQLQPACCLLRNAISHIVTAHSCDGLMLHELLLWWTAQMTALIPQRLRTRHHRSDALLIDSAGSHVGIAERRRGRERELGKAAIGQAGIAAVLATLRRRPNRIVLRVAPDILLERPVELPLAAERDLHGVLAYEMDRLTPFEADDVVWQVVETQRDTAQRRLRLRLALVPRRSIAAILQMLARAGVSPGWLEIAAPEATFQPFALTEAADRRFGTRSLKALAAMAAALALAAIVTPFVRQSVMLHAVNRSIAELSPRVAQVQALRRRLAADTAGTDALAAERARAGDALQVLAAVTDVIPDGTWLSALSLHRGKLRISGQSPAAAPLIPALAEDPNFRNPAFAAPVTRTPDGHADLFTISADLGS